MNTNETVLEKFAKKGEKNVFKNLFGSISDDSDSSVIISDEEFDETSKSIQNKENGGNILRNENIADNGFIIYKAIDNSLDISLLQRKELGIAHQLWPAAELLCNYFEVNKNILLTHNGSENINILELGAGIGLCGIFIAKLLNSEKMKNNNSLLKSHIIITDLEEAIEGINNNIKLNNFDNDTYNSISIQSTILDWNNENDIINIIQKFNIPPLVIAADCIYWECLFLPFFNTINSLINNGSIIIISHIKRWKKDTKFFNLCKKNKLIVEVLLEKIQMEACENTGILKKVISRIYKISK